MSKIKAFFLVFTLIGLIILGYLLSVPEIAPSLKFIQIILVFVIYVAIIALVYAIILVVRNLFQKILVPKNADFLTKIFSFIFISIISGVFIYTTIILGNGFTQRSLVSELDYPDYKLKLYVFDYSLNDSKTIVKKKNWYSPFLVDVSFIENERANDIKTRKCRDTIVFSGSSIDLIYDLKNKKVSKVYKLHSKNW